MQKDSPSLQKKALRDRFFLALIVVEVLVLLEQGVLWYTSTKPATLTAQEGLSTYSGDAVKTEQGISNEAGTGTFATTRWISLRAGMYRMTVHYAAAEGSDAYLNVYSTLALSNDNAQMPAEGTESSITVWVPQRVEDLQLHFIANSGQITVESVEVTPLNNNAILLGLLAAFAALDGLYLLLRRRLPGVHPRMAAMLLCLGAITLFCSGPMFSNQLLGGDDLVFHLHRIEGLAEELKLGMQFPVYLQSDWFGGEGYPVSTFYCDLFLVLPALLRLAGLPLQGAYQVYAVAVNALTAVTAWWAFRHIFHSDAAGVLGSGLYCLAPYRLTDLYRRAALGEYTALAFVPLVLAGLWDIFTMDTRDARYKTSWIPVALGFWGLLQSHLISTEICGLATLLLCVCLLRRTLRGKTFAALCKAAGAALAASAWYLVPLADYMSKKGFIVTDKTTHQDIQSSGSFFGQLVQVFASGSGSGKNLQEGLQGDMVQTPGAALLLAGLLFLLYVVLRQAESASPAWYAGRAAAIGGGAALLCCLWTTPWNLMFSLPVIGRLFYTVQFPWRYLGLACLLLAMVACALTELLRPRRELRI
jgi:hypothetical protein